MADTSAVKEITDKLENGVKELFESDKYAEYLKTMSRFHRYSTRNTLLIHLQDPSAHHVAGFHAWQQNFNRSVKKGEHGIKIFAPIANKGKDIWVEKLDPATKQPILDENGQPVMERLSSTDDLRVRFKLVTVFSERQTEGDPLPELAEKLTGDVERYELFLDALRAVSPLPIVFERLPEDTDGACHFGDRIAIREGMSEIQTLSAIIHELTHSKLHDLNAVAENGEKAKDRRTQEVEAEAVSFVVNSHFGVDTGANSFGYVATWSKGKELKELNASLDTIRKTAASLIDAIDENYRALAKERGIDLTVNTPKTEKTDDAPETPEDTAPPRKEGKTAVEYTEFQKKGFEIARINASLPLQDRLDIIARTFGCKTASVETSPCTGKWRGTSDISIRLDNGASLFIGNRRTPEAKKPSNISDCVNNALATYNPETVAEAKKRAEFALLKREVDDNAVAAEHGLKPYKLLNVEINDGSNPKESGHIGWYYVTVAVNDKIFCLVETGLNYEIAKGELDNRRSYFVAGGLKDHEADFVFNNVGHSSLSTLYKMDIDDAVLERAKETLARREQFSDALDGMKTVEKEAKEPKTRENRLYDKLAEMFPDFMGRKYSYLKLEAPGMEPLSLEWIGAETISVMHTYTMNGDLMYDPMMTFWVDECDGDETLRAESFEQSMPPVYQTRGDGGEWHSVDGNGNSKFLYLDHSIGKFAEQWFTNIAEQGYMPVLAHLARGEDDEVRVMFDKDGNAIEPEPETGNVPYDEAAWHDLADIEDDDLREAHRAEINEILGGGKEEKQTTLDLSLPDPAWTVAEMNEYGYTEPDMYPLSVGRAVELFDAGHTIYLLYDNNTEAMAFDRDEIITHGESYHGFCGITKTDWEMSPIRDAQNKVYENVIINREQIENSKESEIIHSREPMFGIYQVRDDIGAARDFRFVPMRELEALGLSVDRENYSLVYSAQLTERFLHGMLNDNDRTLERLYEKFNDSLPSDYSARSVSVSDVIVLQQGGEVTAHYVDSAGFKELPAFTGNEREQTLSQFDTSSPSVADLEADVKEGKSISVAELAKAVNAERKDNQRIIIGGIPPQGAQKPQNKGVPTLMDEINEAKQLVARGGQAATKQNEREV